MSKSNGNQKRRHEYKTLVRLYVYRTWCGSKDLGACDIRDALPERRNGIRCEFGSGKSTSTLRFKNNSATIVYALWCLARTASPKFKGDHFVIDITEHKFPDGKVETILQAHLTSAPPSESVLLHPDEQGARTVQYMAKAAKLKLQTDEQPPSYFVEDNIDQLMEDEASTREEEIEAEVEMRVEKDNEEIEDLNSQLESGAITEEEHKAALAKINARHGEALKRLAAGPESEESKEAVATA